MENTDLRNVILYGIKILYMYVCMCIVTSDEYKIHDLLENFLRPS